MASAQAAASQRMTPEEIAFLTAEQLRVLVMVGMERLRDADGNVVDI